MERTIAFVYIVKTNAEDGLLDDIISHGSEMLFPDYRDEGAEVWTQYIPRGSHWEEVDPTRTDLRYAWLTADLSRKE